MRERPLSPHLSVWKFTTSMAMSIINRITGVILSIGLLLLAWWLMAAATSASAYAGATRVLSSGLVQLLLAGWLLSFVYHLCNGIRHLTWDMGLGMERHESQRSGVVTLFATVVITAAIGYLAFFARSAS